MSEQQYKFVIDKDKLRDYFMQDEVTPTKEQLKAIDMMVTSLLIKHYSGYTHLQEDLYQECVLAIMDHHDKYDPSYSAYSYMWAIIRNCCHNYIWKYSKETLVDEVLPLSNAATFQDGSGLVHLPSDIARFKKYLSGEQKFDQLDLTQRDAANLLAFFATYTQRKRVKVPDFIQDNPNATELLYNILIKM